MIVSILALSSALLGVQDTKPVDLHRIYTKGEKSVYQVDSNLMVEDKPYGLATFLPEEMDINYQFTTTVKDLKSDGIAVLDYRRPQMIQVDGENADRPAKTSVEKVNWIMDLTVSPINEVLEIKDNTPKKPEKKKGGSSVAYVYGARGAFQLQALVGQFVSELYRLALNVGSLDSAMDFSPKLPYDDVKEGATWKKTVGYSPQKLKGKDGKNAVQRLDYTYTYKGIVTVNGKKFYRVNAALNLKTDLADYFNQLFNAKPEDTHLKSIPMELTQSIDYNLDLKTRQTMSASSSAEGGFKVWVTDIPSEAVQEQKLHGTTALKLVSTGPAITAKKKA